MQRERIVGHPISSGMPALRARATPPPEGFAYRPDFLAAEEERALVAELERQPLKEFDFHGYLGRRRVIFYGWRYDFSSRLHRADPIPEFLHPVRQRAAEFAGVAAADLDHVLLTEYRPGAPIGWHRDRPVFDDVIGISLLSPCVFRFRRKQGAGWERASLLVEPRSLYLLRGPSRREWQHSIPPMEQLRYSITFRSLTKT